MGEKLLKYYHYIQEQKGLEGRVMLAQFTKIPSTKASMELDNADNIKIFKEAVQKIIGKDAPNF